MTEYVYHTQPEAEPRKPKQRKGFAAIDPEYQREIASRGGEAANR